MKVSPFSDIKVIISASVNLSHLLNFWSFSHQFKNVFNNTVFDMSCKISPFCHLPFDFVYDLISTQNTHTHSYVVDFGYFFLSWVGDFCFMFRKAFTTLRLFFKLSYFIL